MWNPFRRKGKNEEGVFGKFEYPGNWPEERQTEAPQELYQEEGQILAVNEDLTTEIPEVSPNQMPLVEDNSTFRIRKIARGVLLALIVLLPSFFLTVASPGDIFTLPKQILIFAAVIIGFSCWLGLIIRQGGAVFRLSGMEFGILGFSIVWLLASVFGLQPRLSFVGASGFLGMIAMILFAFLIFNFFERKDLSRVINFISLGWLLAVLQGLLVIFNLPLLQKILSGMGNNFFTVGSLNVLAASSSVIIVLLISQYLRRKTELENGESNPSVSDRFWMAVKWLAVAGSVIVIFIANWWIFYATVAVGMVGMILAPAFMKRKSGSQTKAEFFVPMVVLVFALLVVFASRYINVPGRQDLPAEISLSQRASFSIASQALNRSPVFGYGPENFRLAFDLHKPNAINLSPFWNVRFNSAASEVLNLAVNGGLLALVGFVALVFYVFKNSFSLKHKAGVSWLIMPAFLSSLFLFFIYPANLVIYFYFWILIGLLGVTFWQEGRQIRFNTNDTSLVSILSSLCFLLIFAGILFGGYTVFQRYRGEWYFAQAAKIEISDRETSDKAVDLLTKAVNVSSYDLKYLNALGQVLANRVSIEIKNPGEDRNQAAAQVQNLLNSLNNISKRLTDDYRNDAISWISGATTYQSLITLINGADESAVSFFREYIKKAPTDPLGFTQLGLVYLDRAERNNIALVNARSRKISVVNEKEIADLIIGDYKKAEENLKKSVELKPDFATPIYNLGIVYEREGRLKEAIKQLEAVAARQFNNANLAFELGLLYYRDSQKDKAFNEMARAVGLFKDYSNARWYLALMLEERGRIDDAIAQLREILKLEVNKDNPVVLAKITSLEAGKREIPPAKVTSRRPLENAGR